MFNAYDHYRSPIFEGEGKPTLVAWEAPCDICGRMAQWKGSMGRAGRTECCEPPPVATPEQLDVDYVIDSEQSNL